MLPVSIFSRIVRAFGHVRAARRILLPGLFLGSTSAWACDDDGPFFAGTVVVLLVLEAIFIALAGLGWWLKQRFWPPKSGGRTRPWFFLLSLATALTSAFIALVGVLYIPAFSDFYAGMGSDLPMASRLVIKSGNVLGLAPLAAAALWWAFRNSSRRTAYVAVMCVAELGILVSALWAAAELPFD